MTGFIKNMSLAGVLLFGFCCIGVVMPRASDFWMSDADLEKTFAGKTIVGIYPSGRGFVETFDIGGRVDYRDDRRRVFGRWSVTARTFCTIYEGDASGGCFLVRRMSENCFEFYFAARSNRQDPRPEDPSWSAQAWLLDAPSTCVAGSEV